MTRLIDQFESAIGAGDFMQADRLLDRLQEPLDQRSLKAAAALHLRRRRWGEAAAVLARVAEPDLSCQLQRCLATNLAAMQRWRPEVYRVIIESPATCRMQVIPAPGSGGGSGGRSGGDLTLRQTLEDGRGGCLTAGPDPHRAVKRLLAGLGPVFEKVESLGLCGLGDGYLLHWLAEHGPRMQLGEEQAVHIVEPDHDVVLHCLMIHDYSGPRGPIENRRFYWAVGGDWLDRLRRTFLDDLMLAVPKQWVTQGLRSARLGSAIQKVRDEVNQAHANIREPVESYYAGLTRDHLLDILDGKRGRQPRVLVVTSRFSTVLQHAARDAAEGFSQIGWETRLVIEPTGYHRIMTSSLRDQINRFHPDMVFQIDHLRYEIPEVYPPNLPVLCWFQDDLPNLTCPEAAASLGQRDFVLLPARPTYTRLFGYPSRQCLDLSKLTRVPERPKRWGHDGDDLVYVSNASEQPHVLADRIIADTQGHECNKRFVRACCDRIIRVYREGRGYLETRGQVRRVVDQVQAEFGYRWPSPRDKQALVMRLIHPLNDALYRQQGLAWAAGVAEQLGLRLAVYGRGWDRHPLFARYAKGYVHYGRDLEDLTRRSRFNLRLGPFPSLSHHRMLDGLVAGGFFLHRRNQIEQCMQALANFIHEHLGAGVSTLQQARDSIDPELTDELARRVQAARELYEYGDDEGWDPIEGVRISQTVGAIAVHGEPLPWLDQISFHDRATLHQRVEQFKRDDGLRSRITLDQRQVVEDRFSYASGLKRVMAQVRQRIATEPTTAQDGSPLAVGVATAEGV